MRYYFFTAVIVLFLAAPAPAYSVTPDEAVQRALAHNPDLRAMRFDEDIAKGRLEKAQLLLTNNPAIEGSISKKDKPEADGGGAFTNYGVKLSQEFEIAGQRATRITVAENELARVQAGIRDKERVLIAGVKDLFTKVLALKKKSDLAWEVVHLKGELLGYAKIKFQAGEISGLDVNLAEVELSKAKKELLLSEREQKEAILTLQRLLGASFDKALAVEGALPERAPMLPDVEALKEAAFSRRPDARSGLLEVEKTKAELNLAKKEIVPNITLSGFYDRDELRNNVGIGISVPLPLFDRNQAQRKEAHAKAESAKVRAEGLKKRIELEVAQAHGDLSSAIEEVNLFNKEIIVKAAENLSLLNLAFKEGKVGFFEVRMAQKETIDVQLDYIEAQARMQYALNAIEKTTGETLK